MLLANFGFNVIIAKNGSMQLAQQFEKELRDD